MVSGHRDAGNTSCPGASTYARLPDVRHAVATELGAGFVDPVVSGGTKHQVGEAGAVRLDAGTLGDLAWTATVTDSSGAVLRSASGSGGQVSLLWDITDTTGAPARPGEYLLRLRGGDDSGVARDFTERMTAPICRGTSLQRARCRIASRRRR